jgi:hypothetical protein
MTEVKFVARVILVAALCAVATTWFGWLSLPFIGFVYALADRRARARGTIAALGAALGWIAILASEATRGANVRLVAERVGEVMQLPAFAFALITLLFAALLCGTAAVIAAALARFSI